MIEGHGILVVDKPRGPTSHGVVSVARRAFGTRAVGHAGTLDPMATGVLVLAIREATKLVTYLAAADKEYEARIRFGLATDTLDADGQVTATEAVPGELDRARLQTLAERFCGETQQQAPAVSAIKVDGMRLHERFRRGEQVETPLRPVQLHRVEVRAREGDHADLWLRCGKGFYVRSYARDVAQAAGTVGHLAALRRTRSGRFGADDAVAYEALDRAAHGDEQSKQELRSRMSPLSETWDGERLTLTPSGVSDAFHGRKITATGLATGCPSALRPDEVVALFSPEASLVALARRDGADLQVVRGFRAV